ncbi:hypothetical protein Vadar_010524 [Vaccinium darrowii]|uniref:Uncharacterized protein n=1 Tax=Vaccinium darrowii TaxID=229202 RepID=A0ACB7XYV4_9ERIC|nr:hypothetical protein Vadar_010524 [Vaccinium darrowii]
MWILVFQAMQLVQNLISKSSPRQYSHGALFVASASELPWGTFTHVNTVATVIWCLSQAPRLPALDWGAIVGRCMKYEGQVAELCLQI